MRPITIRCYVPAASALARGVSGHGYENVPLDDSDVASLSEGARRAATRFLCDDRGKSLDVEVADAAHVVAALESVAAREAADEAETKRQREERIARAVAAPDEDWIGFGRYDGDRYFTAEDGSPSHTPSGSPHTRPAVLSRPSGSYFEPSEAADPRLVARAEAVRAGTVFADAVEMFEARLAEHRALVAAREAREAETVRLYASAISALAAKEDDLARPAAEDYSVATQVLDRLAVRLAIAVAGDPVQFEYAVDSSAYPNQVDRPAPSPEAFRLLDRVTECARRANADLSPAIGAWVVSRIVRLDTCQHPGESHHVTAVLATLRTTMGVVREVTWSTESLACAHDDGEEGES